MNCSDMPSPWSTLVMQCLAIESNDRLNSCRPMFTGGAAASRMLSSCVCPKSVTSQHCNKMTKRRTTQMTPDDSLLFWYQRSVRFSSQWSRNISSQITLNGLTVWNVVIRYTVIFSIPNSMYCVNFSFLTAGHSIYRRAVKASYLFTRRIR